MFGMCGCVFGSHMFQDPRVFHGECEKVESEKRHSHNCSDQVSKSSSIHHRPWLICALTSLSLIYGV